MIPKIIHYCWFGRGEKPDSVVEYIQSWKKHNPDYEIREWNEDNFDVDSFIFTREAYKMKKYAFVSDVCRMVALSKEGGIYLDTDVLVFKSFDSLLHNKSFIGYETPFLPSTAVIGAGKDAKWLSEFLKIYDKKHFIRKKGKMDCTPNTFLLRDFLSYSFSLGEEMPYVYPFEILCAKRYHSNRVSQTVDTIAIHNFSATWKGNDRMKSFILRIKCLIYRHFSK